MSDEDSCEYEQEITDEDLVSRIERAISDPSVRVMAWQRPKRHTDENEVVTWQQYAEALKEYCGCDLDHVIRVLSEDDEPGTVES